MRFSLAERGTNILTPARRPIWFGLHVGCGNPQTEACATCVYESRYMNAWTNFRVWWRGLLAAAIAGGANGVITGFAAVGIDPQHFNLQAGLHSTLAIAGVSAAMSCIIGVAAYLKQSPLPNEGGIRES